MGAIGYVVVEYNQASGQPGIPFGADIHDHATDAAQAKQAYESSAAAVGRRERYMVATVDIDLGDED